MINDEAEPFAGVLAFVAVADALGFRAAAAKLGVTAAAVSRSVQRLEDRLGVRLVERTTRTVRLTPEGERYAMRCREAVAQMRLAEAEVQAALRAPQGTLTVSASPILARLVVPRLGRLLLRHPALRVELSFSDRLVRFSEESVDVALRVGDVADESLVARQLLRPDWVTVASPAYLARRPAPRTIDDLAHHECLRFVPPRGRPRAWRFASGAFEPKGPLDVDAGDALVAAALADVGVAQVLDFMVDDDLRAGRLVEVLANERSRGPAVQAVHPSGRRALPRVRAFVAFLAEELAR
jgi:DNA-binding transcriptional LysR family regulator